MSTSLHTSNLSKTKNISDHGLGIQMLEISL
jgi:hypothetical protein